MDYIKLFSSHHIGYILFFICFYALVLWLPKKFPQRKVELFITTFILIIKLASDMIAFFIKGQPLYTLFPIHVCNVSLILCIIFMIKPSLIGFQMIFYMSLGALAAILFPEAVAPFPDFIGISFFATHFFILFFVAYQMKYLNYKPTLKGIFVTYGFLNILAVVAYNFNNAFGTNYMYINHKPITASPIDFFGPWPFYIIVVELIFFSLGMIGYFTLREKK